MESLKLWLDDIFSFSVLTFTLRQLIVWNRRGGNEMEYGISELSKMAGISTRTLRYYDAIGLLKPSRVNSAGYRYYGQREVDLLWQILFYRERGLDLKQIQAIVVREDCDVLLTLEEHLAELEKEKEHLVQIGRAHV